MNVQNKILYHISRKINWNKGDKLVIGENENPFWNFSKNYSPQYLVNGQPIPVFQMFEQFSNFDLTQDNINFLYQVLKDVSKETAFCIREQVFENIRKEFYPDLPSRQKCLWLTDHQRNQLLREVIRAIVVGAAGNGHRQAVGTVVSQNQQVSGSLGAAVRRASVDRSLLGEEQVRTIQRQITINLIGRNLMVTLNTILTASIHQHAGADDIGLEEDARIFDGTVNMRFCRKVDHDVRMLFFKQLIHSFAVADVGLHEAEVRIIHNRCQCGQITCIGQLVQADDPVIWILFQHVEHKVTTNKTSTAGNNNIHFLLPRLSKNNFIFCHPF